MEQFPLTGEELTGEELKTFIEGIKKFKQLIQEKGTKEAVVGYLMEEYTDLTQEECEAAYKIYSKFT